MSLGGEKMGEFELLDSVFSAEINDALLWEAVKHYRAALRQGTAATKVRKNVSGSGKKLWKQKGTGRARIGSIRSPIWRGGGTVHGPQPRSYEYQFPKKKLMGALRSAISAKIQEGKLTIVDTFELAEGKTKLYRQALTKLETGKTTLLVESSRKLEEKLYCFGMSTPYSRWMRSMRSRRC
jgi:large subunit ribosomal protein L4